MEKALLSLGQKRLKGKDDVALPCLAHCAAFYFVVVQTQHTTYRVGGERTTCAHATYKGRVSLSGLPGLPGAIPISHFLFLPWPHRVAATTTTVVVVVPIGPTEAMSALWMTPPRLPWRSRVHGGSLPGSPPPLQQLLELLRRPLLCTLDREIRQPHSSRPPHKPDSRTSRET